MVVKEDDRGKGIGLKLIKDFIAEARRKGCKKLSLHSIQPLLIEIRKFFQNSVLN